MAVRFSADGQDYTRALSLGSQTQISFCYWMKISTDRNAVSCSVSVDDGTATSSYIFEDSGDGTTHGTYNNAGTQLWSTAMTVGTWYFVGFSANGVNWTATRRAATTTTFTTSTGSNGNSTTTVTNFRLGESVFGGEWFNGCLAAVKLWTGKTLTAAEMQAESFSYMPVNDIATLRCWYPMWRTETADFSGKGNTLSGGSGTATEDGPPLGYGPWGSAVVLPSAAPPPTSFPPLPAARRYAHILTR